MPTYEYKCENCGKVFEVRQRFADEPLKTHEECGGVVNRVLSAPALQFKGSGWYVTDYAKGGSLPPGKKGDDKSDNKGDAKTESKPSESSSTPAASTPAPSNSESK